MIQHRERRTNGVDEPTESMNNLKRMLEKSEARKVLEKRQKIKHYNPPVALGPRH
jgi:hypothetical protein